MKRSGQTSSHNVLKHAAIYLVARGLPGIFAFLAIPIFSRLLDPAGYGKYALLIATVGVLNALLFQWLRLALVRFLPAYKSEPQKLKATLLTTQWIIIAVAALVALAVSLIPHGPSPSFVMACWGMLAIQAPYELVCEYSRAQIQPWRYMGLQVVRSFVATGLGMVLILVGFGWWGPVGGLALGMLLPTIYAYRTDWADSILKIDAEALRSVARYGLPLSLTVALAIVISSSDRFLIAAFLGERAAGLYSVAVDFTAQTLLMLMMVIYLAMFPLAVRAWEERGPEAAREEMRHNGSLLLAIGLPAAIGMCVLAPGFSNCFLGREFRSTAAAIIPLVAIGGFLSGLKACHFDMAFQFVHRTMLQVWIVLVAAVTNIILNLLFIRRFGIQGSAVASLLAYMLSIALTISFGRRYFALPIPWRATLQVSAGCAAMALLLIPWRSHVGALAVAAQLASAMTLYAVVLVGLNFLNLRTAVLEKLARRPAPLAVSHEVLEVAALAETV